MLRRFVEISKQGRAQPALHIEVRRAIPITAVLIGPYPIKLILMTGEGRRGEYQPEATISVGDVRDHAIDRPYVSSRRRRWVTYGAPDRSPAIARLLQRMQQTP